MNNVDNVEKVVEKMTQYEIDKISDLINAMTREEKEISLEILKNWEKRRELNETKKNYEKRAEQWQRNTIG